MIVDRVDYFQSSENDLTGQYWSSTVATSSTPINSTFEIAMSQGVLDDETDVSISGGQVAEYGEETFFIASFTPDVGL